MNVTTWEFLALVVLPVAAACWWGLFVQSVINKHAWGALEPVACFTGAPYRAVGLPGPGDDVRSPDARIIGDSPGGEAQFSEPIEAGDAA